MIASTVCNRCQCFKFNLAIGKTQFFTKRFRILNFVSSQNFKRLYNIYFILIMHNDVIVCFT